MLKTIFSGLMGFKFYALLAAFVAVLAGVGVQTARLTSAQADIRVLTAEKSALAAEKAGLLALIDAQNVGIKAIADKGKQLDAAAARAAVAVNKLAVATEARVKAIESAPTPASCEEAMGFLVREAAGGAQ